MAKQKLPSAPATSGEMYMAAIVEEIRELNSNLNKLLGGTEHIADDEVALKEPAKATTRDAKQAAAKVAPEAVGPVTVETVEVVEPKKPIGSARG